MRKPLYKPAQRTVPIARRLRVESTFEERRLWKALRSRNFEGAKFRRQGRVGLYVVDLVCVAAKLVIEIDGPLHDLPGRKEKDAVRQRWLEQEGYRVLRFTTMEMHHDIDRVLRVVTTALGGDGPSPLAPLPQGERGR